MNVYDFDGTIYDGESTFDFYFYCVMHHIKAVKYVFVVIWNLLKYKLCLISEEKLMLLAEKYMCSFLDCCPDIEQLVEEFWKTHIRKIKKMFFSGLREDDVVVSASFGFLLRPVLEKLKIKNVLCSEIDIKNKRIIHLCFRKNKVILFDKYYDKSKVLDVYTDSENDEALMGLATRNVYLVRGSKITKIN